MSRWPRRLEVATNVAILFFCVAIGGLTLRNYMTPKHPPARPNRLLVGSSLAVPGLNWSTPGKTLVLAISTQCHFCSDSMPFYEKLVRAASNKRNRVVGLLPQSTTEAIDYLVKHNVAISEVHQVSLGSIGIQGTPTIFILDSGKVTAEWVGKLDAASEAEVLAALDSSMNGDR